MIETPEPTHQSQNPNPNFTISEHSTPSMANIGEGSSANAKPVIVRVKRKAFQSPLEAFWLEINERPLKRPLLDFENLSISDSSGKEEVKTKKVLVQHLETVSTSEAAYNILQSFTPNSDGALDSKTKSDKRRHTFKKGNIQDQLLVKARQEQEILEKNARFEQIWRSRKGKNEAAQDKALHEMCHLYDVVRVDVEETSSQAQKQEDMSLEDQRILCNYLPLIREFIPSAAAEIESDIHAYMSKQASADEYVYDLYAVKDDMNITDKDAPNPFPLVQVDEDDEFYAGPPESEFESDDSNAEDNPLNDYPDEETSEDEKDSESRASDDESGEPKSASAGDRSLECENLVQLEDEIYDDYENESDFDYDDGDGDGDGDGDDNTEDWRWSYR